MGFVGNYAPRGLSPQMYDMPVIRKKETEAKRFVSLNSGLSSKWRLPTPTSVIVPSAPKIGKPGLTALHLYLYLYLHLYHLSSTLCSTTLRPLPYYLLSSTFCHTTTFNLPSIFCRLSTLLHSTTPPRQERRKKGRKKERKKEKKEKGRRKKERDRS